jgi:rhomboid protease GluP
VDIVLGGQWWRLVTAGFLHGGILHIFMNSFALFDLGAQVEDIYGSKRMIVLYFVATVFGFLCSTYISPYSISVGASAGLFGLIGAMIALGLRHKSSMGDAVRGLYIRWAVYGLLLGLLPGLRVDNAAHIGGLAAGFGVAYFAGTRGYPGSWSERLWNVAAYACIFLTVVSFLKMFLWFSSRA